MNAFTAQPLTSVGHVSPLHAFTDRCTILLMTVEAKRLNNRANLTPVCPLLGGGKQVRAGIRAFQKIMWPCGARIFGFWRGFGEGACLKQPVTEPKRSQNPKRPLSAFSHTAWLQNFLKGSKLIEPGDAENVPSFTHL
jgi:hypothetical protein